jgi:UDP-2-acetamido-2,6-beta-L-arabino-hexul-4-ose reductase
VVREKNRDRRSAGGYEGEMKVLVTGAKGFVGRNMVVRLGIQSDIEIIGYDLDDPKSLLDEGLETADVIFHLAGVNRPEKPEEYETGNVGFTQKLCDQLRSLSLKPTIIFSSSIQAMLDNPYGVSKRRSEEALLNYAKQTGAQVVIFRMKNVFGKWCRPNFNSVVATFCHNFARNLPVSISDRANEVNLVYVDDVCAAMMEAAGLLTSPPKHFVPTSKSAYAEIVPSFKITLGVLVDTINSFRATRSSLQVPAFDDPFICRLYATYLSYLEESDFAYGLDIKTDNRGRLAEFLKSASFGQIFVSRTKPGITRGNHYHHTKAEKFLVVQGQAIIRFRKIVAEIREQKSEVSGQGTGDMGQKSEIRGDNPAHAGAEIIEYCVSGEEFRVVDIPPGYTHSIENVGDGDLITLFWANKIFDPEMPDTYYEEVERKSDE